MLPIHQLSNSLPWNLFTVVNKILGDQTVLKGLFPNKNTLPIDTDDLVLGLDLSFEVITGRYKTRKLVKQLNYKFAIRS